MHEVSVARRSRNHGRTLFSRVGGGRIRIVDRRQCMHGHLRHARYLDPSTVVGHNWRGEKNNRPPAGAVCRDRSSHDLIRLGLLLEKRNGLLTNVRRVECEGSVWVEEHVAKRTGGVECLCGVDKRFVQEVKVARYTMKDLKMR